MAFPTHDNYNIDKKPDTCPSCGKGIEPVNCYEYGVDAWRRHEGFLQIVYRCPRKECQRLFIGNYINQGYQTGGTMYLSRVYLLDFVDFEKFSEQIVAISKKFPRIYGQALIADENGLEMIAGAGYRKALEFLIKDYLIKTKPEIKQKVKSVQLGDAIKLIEDERIKMCAERAAWIGNDETHYIRKWTDKDVIDLKNLIKMVVDWIDLVERSKKYRKSMPPKTI